MNIKDFKNVTTKPCDIEFDKNYLEKLSQLPQSAPKRHTLEIISTIAAAVLIVVAVSLWAIIGRGVRQNGVQVVAGSYTQTPITSELNAKLNTDLFGKYDVFCFREFNEENPLSVHELLQINRYAENGFYKGYENYVTGKMINDYANKMFGISPAHDFAIYGCVTELGHVDYAGAKVTKLSTEDLTDGTKKIHIEYNGGITPCILEYVGYDIFTPIRFTAFYKGDTELSKTYADEKIYKIICDELEADGNIESYLVYLPEAPAETNDGYSAKIILPDYSFIDGKGHSILGCIEKFKPHQTAELVLNFKKTDDGFRLIKENGEGNKPILTNVTEWYNERSEKMLREDLKNPNENKNKPKPTKANPKTKEFEFLGKKYNLKLRETIDHRDSWLTWRYTDGNGTGFTFDENGGLLRYEYGGAPINSGTVTQDEAKKIATDFAKKMYGDQFDDFVFYKSYEYGPSGPTERYSFSFTKRYGKDKLINGEYCSVSIKINGDVLDCDISDLNEFKKYDLSIFDNLTCADVEKKALSTFSQNGDYTYRVELKPSIAFIEGKCIISVGIIETHKSGGSAGIERYFEVTEK